MTLPQSVGREYASWYSRTVAAVLVAFVYPASMANAVSPATCVLVIRYSALSASAPDGDITKPATETLTLFWVGAAENVPVVLFSETFAVGVVIRGVTLITDRFSSHHQSCFAAMSR